MSLSKLNAMNKAEMTKAFNDFRSKNKVTDENKLRKMMIFSIMKVYTDKLVNEDHKSVSAAIKMVETILNDYNANNSDYLPASTYKTIIKQLKEYSVNLSDNVSIMIDNNFLENIENNLSKGNNLNDVENPSSSLKQAVCEGYRKEIFNKLYKSNNDIWFMR